MIRHAIVNELYLREAGHGDPVLYVHGLGESGLSFEPLIESSVLEGWRHLVPDLPGYGKSMWPDEPPSLEEVADWLAAWLGEVVSEPVVVVGHAMGGVVGILLCERHPHRVHAFLNVEGNISREDCAFSGRAAAFSAKRFATKGRETMLDTIYAAGMAEEALRGLYIGTRLADPRVYHRHARELVALSEAESLAHRFAALTPTTQYVAGVPRGTCDHSKRLLADAGAAWVDVRDAGHWPFVDQRKAFVALLRGFLESVSGPE